MYKISKDFTFSASHRLNGLPAGHKCERHSRGRATPGTNALREVLLGTDNIFEGWENGV
jgi:hypothetical protein